MTEEKERSYDDLKRDLHHLSKVCNNSYLYLVDSFYLLDKDSDEDFNLVLESIQDQDLTTNKQNLVNALKPFLSKKIKDVLEVLDSPTDKNLILLKKFQDEAIKYLKNRLKKLVLEFQNYKLEFQKEIKNEIDKKLVQVKDLKFISSLYGKILSKEEVGYLWQDKQLLFQEECKTALENLKSQLLESRNPEEYHKFLLIGLSFTIKNDYIFIFKDILYKELWSYYDTFKEIGLPMSFNSDEFYNSIYQDITKHFKKFYDKEETEKFFDIYNTKENNKILKSENEKLKSDNKDLQQNLNKAQNDLEKNQQNTIIKEFKPIGKLAMKQDKKYTKLKWWWLGAGLILIIVANIIFHCLGLNFSKEKLISSIAYRIPFIAVFWVGLVFISRRQKEAHNEYIYFTHLYHLLNGMITTSIKIEDKVVKEEYIRAGMSHLASSPISALYGGNDEGSQIANELLKRINLNLNNNHNHGK